MSSKINIQLYNDLDSLARRFIDIYGLAFSQEIQNLNSPITRWLDFRLRYIVPQPRQVIYSDEFPKKLPDNIEQARMAFETKVKNGEDINPYQGRGLIHKNDTSSAKSRKRTDLLWADWGILHFHLTTKPIGPGDYFSERSDYQAFCLLNEQTCVVIDIRPHAKNEGYADPVFMEIIARNWPDAMSAFELKGISPGRVLEADEIHRFRRMSVNYSLTIGGKPYMSPGMGLTSAGTSLNQQLLHIKINDNVRFLAELVRVDPQFIKPLQLAEGAEPSFRLTVMDRGLVLCEEKTMTAFGLNIPQLFLLSTFLFPACSIQKYLGSKYANTL